MLSVFSNIKNIRTASAGQAEDIFSFCSTAVVIMEEFNNMPGKE